MDLTKEEEAFIQVRRTSHDPKAQEPAGIGTAREFWKAKLKKKKFLDDATYIEREGIAE